MSPHDGAIDVPLNAVVITATPNLFGYPYSIELHDGVQTIPASLETHRGWSVATPMTVLTPNTAYVAVVVDTMFHTELARSAFTTGSTLDVTPPEFAGIVSWSGEAMKYPIARPDGTICLGSCVEGSTGFVSRSLLEFADPPASVVLLTFTLYRANDHTVLDERAIPTPWPHVLGFESCNVTSPHFAPGENYCGQLVAFDIAGNVTGTGVESCGVVAACAPMLGTDQCTPADSCEPAVATPSESGCAITYDSAPILVVVAPLLVLRRRRR